MFTGLVECMGVVKSFVSLDTSDSGGNGCSLVITNANAVLVDANLGDSIAVNGKSFYDCLKDRLLFFNRCMLNHYRIQ